jgi:hypothetical protein
MVLKWNLEKCSKRDLIHMAKDRDQSQALVKMVINI